MQRSLIIISAATMIAGGLGILGAAWKSTPSGDIRDQLTPGRVYQIDMGGGNVAVEVLERPTTNWLKVRFINPVFRNGCVAFQEAVPGNDSTATSWINLRHVLAITESEVKPRDRASPASEAI